MTARDAALVLLLDSLAMLPLPPAFCTMMCGCTRGSMVESGRELSLLDEFIRRELQLVAGVVTVRQPLGKTRDLTSKRRDKDPTQL
ncbi:hypothetical protein CABS01_09626 [Colletotrichum abscissum]|uniref:uncharacterized protein n=1 Tax=Colletotrichum abscissum TaxID=1671311 RepID=UPI0027D5680E|nr:uncharacterized protein CABS01_09626 [Colletotrichum abscissum]KAK1501895.1 hypothetical protein CABS01_09626 [Colletotrichum abscissum]